MNWIKRIRRGTTALVPPPFEAYFATTELMDPAQRRFFEAWVTSWGGGSVPSVGGYVSYLFAYMHGLHRVARDEKQPTEIEVEGFTITTSYTINGIPDGVTNLGRVGEVVQELERLDGAYGAEFENFRFYCRYNIAQYWAMLGAFERAANYFPMPALGATARNNINTAINYRLRAGQRVTAADLLSSGAGRLTKFGKECIEHVAVLLDEALDEESRSENLNSAFVAITMDGRIVEEDFLRGSPVSSGRKYPYIQFIDDPRFIAAAKPMVREAENAAREAQGLPAVGEAWISETRLFRCDVHTRY